MSGPSAREFRTPDGSGSLVAGHLAKTVTRVTVKASQRRDVRGQQPVDLLRYRGEHHRRRGRARDERRHAAQSSLLVCHPAQLLARLRVGDRRGRQLGELGDSRLRVGGNPASRVAEAAITPHVRPPTTIGHPTDDRMPSSWASRAIAPDAPTKLSTRAGRPVS